MGRLGGGCSRHLGGTAVANAANDASPSPLALALSPLLVDRYLASVMSRSVPDRRAHEPASARVRERRACRASPRAPARVPASLGGPMSSAAAAVGYSRAQNSALDLQLYSRISRALWCQKSKYELASSRTKTSFEPIQIFWSRFVTGGGNASIQGPAPLLCAKSCRGGDLGPKSPSVVARRKGWRVPLPRPIFD